MRRILSVSSLFPILLFVCSTLPVHAQTGETTPSRTFWGTGYTGLATIHKDTTIAYPVGFYAELGRRVSENASVVSTATFHLKAKEGVTHSFGGFLVGALVQTTDAQEPSGSFASLYFAVQGGIEQFRVNGSTSVPGAQNIRVNSSNTGLVFQFESGLILKVNPKISAKLSGRFRTTSYSDIPNSKALIWSFGIVMIPWNYFT